MTNNTGTVKVSQSFSGISLPSVVLRSRTDKFEQSLRWLKALVWAAIILPCCLCLFDVLFHLLPLCLANKVEYITRQTVASGLHAWRCVDCVAEQTIARHLQTDDSGHYWTFAYSILYNIYPPNYGSKKNIQKHTPQIISHTRSRMSVYIQNSSCAMLHMTNEQAIW